MHILGLFNSLPYAGQYIITAALFTFILFIFKYLSEITHGIVIRIGDRKNIGDNSWIKLIGKNSFLCSFLFMVLTMFLASSANVIMEALNLQHPTLNTLFYRVLNAFSIITVSITLSALLGVMSDRFEKSINLPVKGLVQAIKIIIWIITIILAISTLTNKDPAYLIGGLTALSAILIMIFQNAILGLVSGFQLILNDLVRVGDWIVMPNQNADGEVIDILLTTVRVRNWDNTIVNIPANSFISTAFTNWRGMSESGGRRIKRSINIDMKSIHFLNDADIEKLEKFNLLREYLEKKKKQIRETNTGADEYNARRLSNIGTFRAYCLEYLKHNRNISRNFTCMVRQLAPTTEGLPLEIYCFCNNTDWVYYEGVQSDIFDHLLSVISVFDLKVYQKFGQE